MEEQNRLKSPVVWSAIGAQLLTILVLTGAINTGVSDAINALIASILQVLVAFGVFNNPKNKGAF